MPVFDPKRTPGDRLALADSESLGFPQKRNVEKRLWLRLAVGVASVFAATALRLVFLQALGTRQIFLTFFPAVMLAALYGGLWVGLLATALSAGIVDYLWQAPAGFFPGKPVDWISLTAFILGGALMSCFAETMRRSEARRRNAEMQARLAAANQRDQDALRASWERFRVTLTSIGDGVITADNDGSVTFINPVAEALTGWKSEEVLDQPIKRVFRVVNQQTHVTEDIVTRALKEGHVVKLAERTALITKDGREVPIEDSAAPILDDGKVIGVVVVFHDVTEKRRAEQAVFGTQQRLNALLEALPVGVHFSDDITCQFIGGNPAALAQFDARPGDNISASALDDSEPGRLAKFFRDGRQISDFELPVQRAVAENRVILPCEMEIQLPSGRRWIVEMSGAPIRDQHGIVVGGVAVTVDISDRKKGEDALRHSEERWSTTLSSIGDAVIATDANGQVSFLNPAAEELTGLRAEEARSQPSWGILQFINEQTGMPAEDIVAQVLREGHSITLASGTALRARDGREFPIEVSAAPILDRSGNVVGVVLVFRDVTEKRRSEEQKLAKLAIEKVSGQLIEAQEKERSRIARELHDDICQELALLSNELQLLQSVDATSDQPDRRRAAERRSSEIVRHSGLQLASQHCSKIGLAVQALSHEIHSSNLDYLGITAAARSFCREFSEKYRLVVEFTSADVPSSLPRDVSLCLYRILQEALRNAAKHSGADCLKASLRGTPDGIELEVRDAGIGFDLQKATVHGGLGIVSMQERVNLVQGKLSIDSKPNRGTTISVSVPLEKDKAS